MKCPKCGFENDDNNSTCISCGEVFEKEIEYLCPVCQSKLKKEDAFCSVCGAKTCFSDKNLKSGQEISTLKPEHHPKKHKKNKKLKLIILLMIILIFCVIFSFSYFIMSDPFNYENTENENPDTLVETEESNPVNDENADITDDRSENEQAKLQNPDRGIFLFNNAKWPEVTSPEFKIYENNDFKCRYPIPSHFENSFGINVYTSPDNTARIDLREDENYEKSSPEKIMNEYITASGGEIIKSTFGDTWFQLILRTDGIKIYIKGFVDEFINVISFSYPEHYDDVYSFYITEIEKNFRKIEPESIE